MNREEILSRLKPGDVIFYKKNPWKPEHWAIEWAINSDLVHTTIYIGDGLEVTADFSGGVYVRSIFTEKIYAVKRYTGKEIIPLLAAKEVLKQTGKPYNIIGAITVGLITKFQIGYKIILTNGGLFCSESVTDAYVRAGDDLVPEYEDGETTPAAVWASRKLALVFYA